MPHTWIGPDHATGVNSQNSPGVTSGGVADLAQRIRAVKLIGGAVFHQCVDRFN